MRRLLLSLLLTLATLSMTAGLALAQAGPGFRNGFQTLAQLIPGVVGQPLEDERFLPDVGDSLQRTTTGLMVWRKADNHLAFTDGLTTWVLGPSGLQSRPNDSRFDWERPDPLVTLPEGAVGLTCSRTSDGSWVGQGTVRNPRSQPLDVEINLVGLASPGGTPVAEAPTLFVTDLPPGSSRAISIPIPTAADIGEWRLQVTAWPSAGRAPYFLDVGTTAPLNVDPLLLGAVETLRGVDGGEWLVRVAAENDVAIRSGPTPANVLGAFFPARGLALISSRLNAFSSRVRAAVLAHELQHAADTAAGNLPETPIQCLQFEYRAFTRQADVWRELWQGNLPTAQNAIVDELNDVATAAAEDPEALARELVRRYGSDCGLVP